MGEAPALVVVGKAGWPDPRTRISPTLATRPHQRPCAPLLQTGGEEAGEPVWGAGRACPQTYGMAGKERCPFPPTVTQMLGSSSGWKGAWGWALSYHFCLRSGLAQPSAPAAGGWGASQGRSREAAPDLGGGSGKQPRHQRAAGGGTPVGREVLTQEEEAAGSPTGCRGCTTRPPTHTHPEALDADSPPPQEEAHRPYAPQNECYRPARSALGPDFLPAALRLSSSRWACRRGSLSRPTEGPDPLPSLAKGAAQGGSFCCRMRGGHSRAQEEPRDNPGQGGKQAGKRSTSPVPG